MLASSYSFAAMNLAPGQEPPAAAADVAEKVMRRVEIAKVARNLQDCLAFASFKARNGWEERTLRSIEPEITEKLRRKRPYVENDYLSDEVALGLGLVSSDSTYLTGRKRVRANSTSGLNRSSNAATWKQDHHLPQSSPVDPSAPFESSYNQLEDSPMFDVRTASEDEDHHMSSTKEPASSIISSSPPRTPPPSRRLLNTSKQTGADLLLYLANSPRSPAVHVAHISSASKDAPSTPPSQHSHLPSSVMRTPGAGMGLFNGALQTPGQNFNFADFCNVTPSPAQAHRAGRTPVLSKTPARLARGGLNFDNLVPPTTSPTLQRRIPTTQGLALQLGEELVPRS